MTLEFLPRPDPGPGASTFLPVQGLVAAQPPDRIALRAVDAVLTYAQLNARANQIAHRLGHGPEGPVAICLERTAEAVVALLGTLRSGRPFLPLDPRQPAHHLQELLARAGAGCLVTRTDLWGGAPATRFDLPVLALDLEKSQLERESTQDPACPIIPEDLAYCLYTSGTRGRPKCVDVAHASLAVYPGAFNSRLGLAACEVYLHSASFAFSAALRQLFVPLSVGACVVLADASTLRDPLGLLRLARQERVAVLDWVPSYLRRVCTELERLPQHTAQQFLGPHVRILLSSGEPLSWALAQRWRHCTGFAGRMASCYGQTETAGLVAWYELPLEPPVPTPTWVPLGEPLPQARLHALDAEGHPARDGNDADLWVEGPCLARGTRDGESPVVRPAPWSGAPPIQATGDRVHVGEDGVLTFAGRADDQVKVNGVRINLAEVEEALRGHPQVADAAVLAEADGEGGLHLHGFCESGPDLDLRDLRQHLRERHPGHLQPHRLSCSVALPRTPSGKVDRPALRASLEAAPAPASLGPPQGFEGTILDAWRAALGRDAGEGDFFEQGGDSLQAITMLGRIASALQLEAPLIAAFFGDPTLEGLRKVVREGLAAGPAPPLTALPRPASRGRT